MSSPGRQKLPASALRSSAVERLGAVLIACAAMWGLIIWSIGGWSY